MSTRRQLMVHRAFPLKPRGPNGEKYCRVCGTELTNRCRNTCSSACYDAVAASSSVEYQRAMVFERDRGECAECGCDTKRLDRILRHARGTPSTIPHHKRRRQWRTLPPADDWLRKKLAEMGFRELGRLWDMAHIRDVADGGGIRPGMTAAEILANLRTLCTPCHKAETARRRKK